MSDYGLQVFPTGLCVHFIDEAPPEAELREFANELKSKNVDVVYIDFVEFSQKLWAIPDAIGFAAGTDHPPYSEGQEVSWTRWWDDMLSLGSVSTGLMIVIDNAHLLLAQNRKFLTDLLENFLHGQRAWIKGDVPYHLCFQMVACPSVKAVFHLSLDGDSSPSI
jgi:hypothetical protein